MVARRWWCGGSARTVLFPASCSARGGARVVAGLRTKRCSVGRLDEEVRRRLPW